MKLTVLTLLFSGLVVGADTKPKPLSDKDKLVIATEQVALLQAQIQVQPMVQKVQSIMDPLQNHYNEVVKEVVERYKATGCDVNTKQEWVCPTTEKGKVGAPGVDSAPVPPTDPPVKK